MEYKVVVIDSLVDQTNLPQAMVEIGKIWSVKKKSFDLVHNGRYFPISEDDFFGINVAVIDQALDIPVVVFKVTPHSYCNRYDNINFPFYKLIEKNCDPLEVKRVKNYVDFNLNRGLDISYSGGWAENYEYKGRGLSNEFKELYTAMHYWTHKHYKLSGLVGFAVDGARSFEFFTNSWGLKTFSDNGHSFPMAPHAKCRLIYNDVANLSPYTLECADKWKSLWDNRVSVGEDLMKEVA